jgi:hypothetical protein
VTAVEHAFDVVVRLTKEREAALDRMRAVHLIAFTESNRISWREQWRRVHRVRTAYAQASEALVGAHERLRRWSRAMHRARPAVVEGS